MATGLEMRKGNKRVKRQRTGQLRKVITKWERVPTTSPLWRWLWDLLLHNPEQGKGEQPKEGPERETPLGEADGQHMLSSGPAGNGE